MLSTPLSLLFFVYFFLLDHHSFFILQDGKKPGEYFSPDVKAATKQEIRQLLENERKKRKEAQQQVCSFLLFLNHQYIYPIYTPNISICRDLHINILISLI